MKEVVHSAQHIRASTRPPYTLIAVVTRAREAERRQQQLKDQWKSAPVYSIGWRHTRARAVADSAAADFYFAIIRSRPVGPTAW